MLYLSVRFLTIVLFKILFRLQAFGRGNIPLKGGFILAANHTSYLDPPVLAAACPRKLCFLAKEELFKTAFSRKSPSGISLSDFRSGIRYILSYTIRKLISSLNTYPINKQSGDFGSLRRAMRELEAGRPLAIFPEGRRISGGELAQPSKGIGFLAAKAGVPIVPAFIEGASGALPVGGKFIRPKKIRVYFGRALKPQELIRRLKGKDYYQSIAELTMNEIARLKENK